MIARVLFLSLLTFVLLACQKEAPELVHITGKTMGTSYNVKYIKADSKVQRKAIAKEIELILKRVNQQMSTYQKDSEISYFNHHARLGHHKISEDFFSVTDYALTLAKKTKGKFDPTIGPLVNLWGFGPDGKRKVPKKEEIEEAKLRVGYQKLELNKKELSIKKLVPGIYLDLSASAKGFGVDKVADFLERMSIKNFLVEIGGEVRARGYKLDKRPWKIAIQSPHPSDKSRPYHRVLNLVDMTMATSGDYRNFFKENGKKYSHTIDFQTGRPVVHTMASVSVAVKGSCMKADSLATALMVLGPIEGPQFAEKEKIAAYFIYKLDGQEDSSFVTQSTKEFERLFPKKIGSRVH